MFVPAIHFLMCPEWECCSLVYYESMTDGKAQLSKPLMERVRFATFQLFVLIRKISAQCPAAALVDLNFAKLHAFTQSGSGAPCQY